MRRGSPTDDQRARLRRTIGGSSAGVAVWALFALEHHWLPVWLRFVLAGGVFVFGPGAALVWPALPGASLFQRVVLALGFGMAAGPLIGHLLGVAGLLYLYPYLAAALTGGVLGRWGRLPAGAPRWAAAAAPAVLLLVALALAYVTYAHRVVDGPAGTAYYGEYDTFDITYYAAIAGELTHTIPPAAPFQAGSELNHAFYPQMVPAMLRLFAGVPLLDTYFYYVWPAFLALAALMCFVFVESLLSRAAAFLAALLLIVGSDLSYLAVWFYPNLHRRWDHVVWSANFLSPAAETLLFNNWTPTLVVVFAGFYALGAHERDPRRIWILCAGVCFAVLAQFKPFAYASVVAGLTAAAVMSWKDPAARRRFLWVGAVVAGVSAPYVFRIVTFIDDAQATAAPDAFILPRIMLDRLSLLRPALEWAGSLGLSGVPQLILVGALATPLFLIGGFGFRLVGLPGVVMCLVRPLRERPVWRMLAWTIAAAVTPPFVLSTVPLPYETMHFQQFALFLLPIFVARAVMARPGPAARVVASILVVGLAVPSTFHYVHRKWADHERLFADILEPETRVAARLRETDPKRTVVLHDRPRRASLVAILAERRSVLSWGSYVRGSEARQRDVERFFRSGDTTDELPLAVLEKYRPTHVLVYPETDQVHPAVLARLTPIFESPSVVLYQVPDDLCLK